MTVRDDLATLRDYFGPPGKFSPEWKLEGDCSAALARVEAEITRLEREANEQEGYPGIAHDWLQLVKRAEAAEAEAARLRDGLRQIANLPTPALRAGRSFWAEPQALARALLADQGGAA